MNLEQQVTSLELSKRLKELYIEQETLFYWVINENYSDNPEIIYAPTDHVINGKGELDWPRNFPEDCYSAYTASELLEILPEWSGLTKIANGFYQAPVYERAMDTTHHTFGETACDALAKMIIFMKENNLRLMTD